MATTVPGTPPIPNDRWYQRLVESVTDYGIFSMAPDARIVTWNSGARRLFGYGPAEVVGRRADFIFTLEDREAGVPEKEFNGAMERGSARDDRWHVRRDGTQFWANGVMTALRGGAGDVIGLVKVVQDRTSERRVEESLRESESLFAGVVLGNPAPILVTVLENGRIVLANEAFLQLTGYWRSEVIGATESELRLWADDAERQTVYAELAKNGRCEPTLISLRHKGGGSRSCMATFQVAPGPGRSTVIATFSAIPNSGSAGP
jgi:PAS domain S-box-containing protein